MIELENVCLGKKTTFGIGGNCKKFLVPESEDELIQTVLNYPDSPLLAGGSNVIISDLKEFDIVISLLKFNMNIVAHGNGYYTVGASVRNQILINAINNDGFGGIENLYSVPGTVGGAIYMNAGTGKEQGKCIGKYVESVVFFDGDKIRTLSNAECEFAYRTSYFQKTKGVILCINMRFEKQAKEISERLIRERLERCKKLQDNTGKSCGTFCRVSEPFIMQMLKKWPWKNRKGVYFSNKTHNWLVNGGEGSYSQVKKCISKCQFIHKILRKKMELEVILWE